MASDRQLEWVAHNKRWRATYQPVAELAGVIARRLAKIHDPCLRVAQGLWPELVGSELAELSFPSGLRNGIIIVSVATPAAKFMIDQIYRPAALDQLRRELGRSIRDLRCILQPLPAH